MEKDFLNRNVEISGDGLHIYQRKNKTLEVRRKREILFQKKKEKTKEMKYWRYIALGKHVKESNASHSLEIKKLKR